eukprot:12264834-Alexandrium_andersonii.AAC.1
MCIRDRALRAQGPRKHFSAPPLGLQHRASKHAHARARQACWLRQCNAGGGCASAALLGRLTVETQPPGRALNSQLGTPHPREGCHC